MQFATTAAEKAIWTKSNQKKKDNFQQSGKFKASGSGEQTNHRVQLVDQDDEDDENIMVLNVEGNENTSPYYMKDS